MSSAPGMWGEIRTPRPQAPFRKPPAWPRHTDHLPCSPSDPHEVQHAPITGSSLRTLQLHINDYYVNPQGRVGSGTTGLSAWDSASSSATMGKHWDRSRSIWGYRSTFTSVLGNVA